MKSADDIRQLFKKAELRIHPDADERMFEDVLQARRHPMEDRPATPDSTWRTIMRSPLTKLAAAAVVVIACGIGLSVWRTTGSGIALADVLARVEQVKGVKFKWTWKISGGDPDNPYNWGARATSFDSREYGTKSKIGALDPNDQQGPPSEKYDLPQKRIRIVIYSGSKRYTRQELKDADVEGLQKESIAGDPLSLLKGIRKSRYESLGRSTMDGIEVAGFRATDPNHASRRFKNQQVDDKIWVDVKTLLPVRYDHLSSYEVDNMRDRVVQQIMMYEFQWDVPVDAGEFEPPPIPDGYRIQDIFPDLANEETAIGGLKQSVELLGNYPERVDFTYLWSEFEKSETAATLRLQEGLKGLTGLERDNKKMDALKPMRFLVKFYLGLAKKDSAYYGKTVTPKDADKVLLRWKLSDKEYRVLFGDLHAQTVTAEALAELEKNLPK